MTIDQAAHLIIRGEVVAFPTETVYGLGAHAKNPEAISKIYAIKGRPADNPLIVHLSEISQVDDFAEDIPQEAKKLMEIFWPGPLTLVLKKKPEVLDAITSGLPTVALRIPDHPIALELIRLTGPLVAPSANKSGRPSPTNAEHVWQDFGKKFPVLDGGPTKVGLESTVLDMTRKPYTILRPGKCTVEAISGVTGTRIEIETNQSGKPRSPGVKYSHYKPKADVSWYSKDLNKYIQGSLLLTHTFKINGIKHHVHYDMDYTRMARELYDQFRKADLLKLNRVLIEPLPEQETDPIIRALKDRIDKAVSH
jgi:L-threonylcarbamoyladenylate synthase